MPPAEACRKYSQVSCQLTRCMRQGFEQMPMHVPIGGLGQQVHLPQRHDQPFIRGMIIDTDWLKGVQGQGAPVLIDLDAQAHAAAVAATAAALAAAPVESEESATSPVPRPMPRWVFTPYANHGADMLVRPLYMRHGTLGT